MMKKIILLMLALVMCLLITGCGSSELAEKTGMNDGQEKAAIKIFNENGITELSNIEKSAQNENLFIVKDSKFGMVFFELAPDKSIKTIVYESEPVYANGQSINKFSDLIVSNNERVDYEVVARNAVKNNLKAPSTADFKFGPLITRNKNIVLVRGKVDAQNSFGAMIRSNYKVKIQLPDKKVLEVHIQ
ncbi:hypothetical protein [Phascolarctobacterium faecium]|uniref:hypothetical protein n=1 Tax=Phascolarctobacterium faecium TaxID=33025 RepID=UPI00265DC3B7|nr:hypothetical protein [Phascolarctobacterium faecium]